MASSGLTCKGVQGENDVDGYNYRTNRCFLGKQLKPRALGASTRMNINEIMGRSIILMLLVALSLNYCSKNLPEGSDLKSFDRNEWLSSDADSLDEKHNTQKQYMLADLVENYLPKKTGTEIQYLLGPSLDNSYFSETERDLIYWIGPERGYMRIDSEWLLIWLDDSGVFKGCEIRTD